MLNSLVVSLLAERPETELREKLAQATAELQRLRVETAQIEEALAKQARRGSRPSRRASRGASTTRKRIHDVVASRNEPVSPAEIIAEMREQGSAPKAGAIHNMVKRMLEAGELVRPAEGQYQLASRADSPSGAARGANENGSGSPLSRAESDQSRA